MAQVDEEVIKNEEKIAAAVLASGFVFSGNNWKNYSRIKLELGVDVIFGDIPSARSKVNAYRDSINNKRSFEKKKGVK